MNDLSITKQQYEEFEADYTWTLITVPTYRYGQAFMNYFHPAATEYLQSISHLGGNPGHAPNDDVILWNMKNKQEAKNFILDRFDIK